MRAHTCGDKLAQRQRRLPIADRRLNSLQLAIGADWLDVDAVVGTSTVAVDAAGSVREKVIFDARRDCVTLLNIFDAFAAILAGENVNKINSSQTCRHSCDSKSTEYAGALLSQVFLTGIPPAAATPTCRISAA